VTSPSLDALRRFAVARSLFAASGLQEAIDMFGFIQADPIRAPARAQDLTLRHRVGGYRAGDLERQQAALLVEEDFFVNYGFLSRAVHALMHPRTGKQWPASRRNKAAAILDFIRDRGTAHPREVDQHFAHGRVTNYWGGSSNATTHLLTLMHYRGMLRVVRRDGGVRVYAVRQAFDSSDDAPDPDARLDALVDVIVRKYAPLPGQSLSFLVRRLRYGTPQWHRRVGRALQRATKRLAHARLEAVDWYWPADEPINAPPVAGARFFGPFDPIVWDRRRFELLWGWAYRFEAYTPVAKRKLGYYALPLIWRDRAIGWGNVSLSDGALHVAPGFVDGEAPRERAFGRAMDEEVERLRGFLGAGRVG
jgi:uncharacterized protein YcaQ